MLKQVLKSIPYKTLCPQSQTLFEEELSSFTDGGIGDLSCHLTGKKDSETCCMLTVLTFLFYSFLLIKLRMQTLTWIKQFGQNIIKGLWVLKILQEWTQFTDTRCQCIIAKLWLADLIPVSTGVLLSPPSNANFTEIGHRFVPWFSEEVRLLREKCWTGD